MNDQHITNSKVIPAANNPQPPAKVPGYHLVKSNDADQFEAQCSELVALGYTAAGGVSVGGDSSQPLFAQAFIKGK